MIQHLNALLALMTACLAAPPAVGAEILLPGISNQVISSGPAAGAHPTRADSVSMRYVGRLANGDVFSTSPADGTGASTFPVNGVIPGMSAALQLMRLLPTLQPPLLLSFLLHLRACLSSPSPLCASPLHSK